MGRRIILNRLVRSDHFPGAGGQQKEKTPCQQNVPSRPPKSLGRADMGGRSDHFPDQERPRFKADPHGAFSTESPGETKAKSFGSLFEGIKP
jgi:hypothetical protein